VWFSGEYGSLLATNEVRVKQDDPLVLEFVPLEKNISKKIIKSITITFREDQKYLKRIQIQEKSGDVTTITFMNTQLNVPVDNADFEVRPVRKQSSLTIPDNKSAFPFSPFAERKRELIISQGVQG